MYVSAISRRFSRGRLTPAILAIRLPLPLLVPRIRADDHDGAVPLDHAAPLAHRLDGRSYFHARRSSTLSIQPRSGSAVSGHNWIAAGRRERLMVAKARRHSGPP